MKPKQTLQELIDSIDFPHTRAGKWLKTGSAPTLKPGFSFDRLCCYAKKLRALGMADVDIMLLFSDLYWDAVDENNLNQKAAEPALSKRNVQITENLISCLARGGEKTGVGNLTLQFIGEPPTFNLILLTETQTNCGRGTTLLEAFSALLTSTQRGTDGQKQAD